MNFTKIQSLSLVVVVSLIVIFFSLEQLGSVSAVLAQEQELTEYGNQAQSEDPLFGFVVTIVFTDPAVIDVYDPSGNLFEGRHGGAVRCKANNNCSKRTQLALGVPLTDPVKIVYKFSSRQALDPDARRVVVAGTGTISSGSQTERFLFTATFEDNRDGTILVTYAASRPDASFIIPKSPGTFEITSRK